MLPDCPLVPIWSGCDIRTTITPGAKALPNHSCLRCQSIQRWSRWWRGGGASGSSGGFATIQAAEYFVDTDPGEGNGAFQAQDGAFDSEVESILPKDLNVTLAVGPHLVGVRYQDNNNTWGCFTKPFMSTTPIHPVVEQAVAVVAPVLRPVDLPPFRRQNILLILIRGRKRDCISGTGRGL